MCQSHQSSCAWKKKKKKQQQQLACLKLGLWIFLPNQPRFVLRWMARSDYHWRGQVLVRETGAASVGLHAGRPYWRWLLSSAACFWAVCFFPYLCYCCWRWCGLISLCCFRFVWALLLARRVPAAVGVEAVHCLPLSVCCGGFPKRDQRLGLV